MIFNLVNREKSEVNYDIINFSDSQSIINLTGDEYQVGRVRNETVVLYSRMSWADMQNIILVKKILDNIGCTKVKLWIPYFLGARSDRQFEKISCNYLRDIICPIINSLNFSQVIVLDPHSNCLEMGIKNFTTCRANELYDFAIQKTGATNYCLIGPDKGSYNRTLEAAKHLGKDMLICDKVRDIHTGKILSIDTGNLATFKGQDVFIIDDICDGGRTFVELAKKLKNFDPGKMYLVVSHGIFSNGFKELEQYFDGIFTTNSVKDFSNESTILNQVNLF